MVIPSSSGASSSSCPCCYKGKSDTNLSARHKTITNQNLSQLSVFRRQFTCHSSAFAWGQTDCLLQKMFCTISIQNLILLPIP